MNTMFEALKNAGVDVKEENKVKDFESRQDVKLPFVVGYYGQEVCLKEISDANYINKSKQDLDVNWFKKNVKPSKYDKLYSWILKNSDCVKVVNRGRIHRKLVGQQRLCFKGNVIDGYTYEHDTEYGYSVLGFYLYWNPYTRQMDYCISTEFRNLYNISYTYSVGDLEEIIKALNILKNDSLFIPLVLDELNNDGVKYNEPGRLSSMSSTLGICILESSHMRKVFEGLEEKPIINPNAYYFVIRYYLHKFFWQW